MLLLFDSEERVGGDVVRSLSKPDGDVACSLKRVEVEIAAFSSAALRRLS
jgi:hypothetical protein